MIELEIPGERPLRLKRLLLDYNGTLARDGEVLSGVEDRLRVLGERLELYVVTADTFGTVKREMEGSGVEVKVLTGDDHTEEKRQLLEELGPNHTVAMGNGNNDRLMLEYSVLGIAILGDEGCALETMQAARVCCRNITDALDLLIHPKRLVATLRR